MCVDYSNLRIHYLIQYISNKEANVVNCSYNFVDFDNNKLNNIQTNKSLIERQQLVFQLNFGFSNGGEQRDRTADLLRARQALSQLS